MSEHGVSLLETSLADAPQAEIAVARGTNTLNPKPTPGDGVSRSVRAAGWK